MLDCPADNGEMQERRKDEEGCMDNGNVPELCPGTRKDTDEDQTEAKSTESGCSEGPSWQPEESDSLPSILMAAFLALVFLTVSMVLLCHETPHFPSRDLQALSSHTAHLPKGDFQTLHRLFPNQLESTWRTILRSVCNPLGKSHLEEPWILVGTGPGDASQTLLCFTKTMLSLLTRQKSIGVEFLDPTSPWLPPMGPSENRTWRFSSVKVLGGEPSLPRGLVVTGQSLRDGKVTVAKNAFALLGDGVEKILLQRLTPSLISRILSLNPEGRPKEVMIDHEDYLVLFITSEPYLESGLVC